MCVTVAAEGKTTHRRSSYKLNLACVKAVMLFKLIIGSSKRGMACIPFSYTEEGVAYRPVVYSKGGMAFFLPGVVDLFPVCHNERGVACVLVTSSKKT